MKVLLPLLFATIAAIGNAIFALGQKESAVSANGLLFVAASAGIAMLAACVCAPLTGAFDLSATFRGQLRPLVLSGGGLFLTYLGFNLLYSRFGATQYVLYAVISIITTTLFVGMFWLKEPLNGYHKFAIALALLAVVVFSIGQSRA